MAEFPAMPLWTDALIGDTTHLSATEFGAYMRILVSMWRNRGWLPSDEKLLMKYSSLSAGQWKRSRAVLMPFLTLDGDRLTQMKLLKIWVAVERKSQKAKNSANARWLKDKEKANANASNPQCERNANQNQSSEAKASGADAPDLSAIIFGQGLGFLLRSGVKEGSARSMLGKWRGQHGDEALLAALGKAQREGALDPVAFVQGCFRGLANGKGKADDKRNRILQMAARRDGCTEAERPVDGNGGDGAPQPVLSTRHAGRS